MDKISLSQRIHEGLTDLNSIRIEVSKLELALEDADAIIRVCKGTLQKDTCVAYVAKDGTLFHDKKERDKHNGYVAFTSWYPGDLGDANETYAFLMHNRAAIINALCVTYEDLI